MALVGKVGLVGKLEFHGDLAFAIGVDVSVALKGLDLEQAVFVDVDVHMDGVDADNGRKEGGPTGRATDVVPLGDECTTDPTRNGRTNVGVRKLNLSGVLGCFGSGEGGLGLEVSGFACVGLLGRESLGFEEHLYALELFLRDMDGGLGTAEVRLGAFKPSLEGPGIDLEEKVSLLDQGARVKMHLGEVAGDTGAEFDRFGGFHATRELLPFDEGAFLNAFERDRRGRHATLGTFILGRRRALGEQEEDWEKREASHGRGGGLKLTSWFRKGIIQRRLRARALACRGSAGLRPRARLGGSDRSKCGHA